MAYIINEILIDLHQFVQLTLVMQCINAGFMLYTLPPPANVGLVWGGGKLSIPLLFPPCLAKQSWRCERKRRAPPTFICLIFMFF